MVSLTGLSNFATDYTDFWRRKDVRIDVNSIRDSILKLLVQIDVPFDADGAEIRDIDDYKGSRDEVTYRQIHFKWKDDLDRVVKLPVVKRSVRGVHTNY
jgi:hypothetical protein